MNDSVVYSARIRAAWEGRIPGCMLGKTLEVLSFQDSLAGLHSSLQEVSAAQIST